MLARSLWLSCSVVLGTTCLAPLAFLQADEHSPDTAQQKKKHTVTIELNVDGNDVQWESDSESGSAEAEQVVEMVQKMLADPRAPHAKKMKKRVLVFRGDDEQRSGHHQSEDVEEIMEMIQDTAGDHGASPIEKRRQRVFVWQHGDEPREQAYQAIVVGDGDDVDWDERDERVDLGHGKVWIRRMTREHGDDEPSYRIGIMLGEPVGVVIQDTVEDSPAAKAGLRAGDLLLAVNGQTVSDPSMLLSQVAEAGAADKPLRLLIVRDNFSQVKTVKVRAETIQNEASDDDSPSDSEDEEAEHEEEEHAHEHEHAHDHAQALNELREELEELRGKIKKLQRSLRDDD